MSLTQQAIQQKTPAFMRSNEYRPVSKQQLPQTYNQGPQSPPTCNHGLQSPPTYNQGLKSPSSFS